MFPDSGTSDASDTGFDEAMDVSDGNCDLNFGPVLANDLIRAISFDHSFNLFILNHQYAYSPYCSL